MTVTFGQRFGFARWWQELLGRGESDARFAAAAFGAPNSSSMTDYRRATETPNSLRMRDAAERTGVDYDWLIGSAAEPPATFPNRDLFMHALAIWLETHRPVAEPVPVQVVEIQRDYEGAEPGTAKRTAEAKKTPARKAAGGKGRR